MTTPTKEQCVQRARAEKWCNRQLKANEWVCTTDQLHAFAIRVLAEKELEVLKLQEALKHIFAETDDTASEKTAFNALSTPPSTEALDEYVAARMAESEDRLYAERYKELIFAVGNNHAGKSRHETALMYIRQAECGEAIEDEKGVSE